MRPVEPEAAQQFRDQLLLIWRHRAIIAACAVGLAVAGGIFSIARPRSNEAAAVVAISPPRLGEQAPAIVQAEAFVPLLENQGVAARIAAEFKLADAPYHIAASELTEQVITVHPITASGFIRIVARLNDPAVAASLANRFATESIESVRRAGRDEVAAVEEALQPVLAEAATRLETAERGYDEFRRSARLELLTKEGDDARPAR